MHHNSLANLAPPWTSETSPRHDRTGERSSVGMSYLQWLSELDKIMPDGTAFHSTDELEKIADDGRAPRSKRAAARDLLGMARGDYFKAQPMMTDHINRVMDRSVGRPNQAIHMTSEEQTTIRVVLLDRTESPTHKMVQEVMRGIRAEEPKQLEADEPKQTKPVENESVPENQPAHPGARVGMDWRTASAGPVSDPT